MFAICCPLFSYLGVMGVEAGMVDLKDLRPFYLRLLPSFSTDVVPLLPKERQVLQKDVRAIIKKYGPEVGDIYFSKEVCWEQELKKIKTLTNELLVSRGQEPSEDEDSSPASGSGGMKTVLSSTTLDETAAAAFSHLPTLTEIADDADQENVDQVSQVHNEGADESESMGLDISDDTKKNN